MSPKLAALAAGLIAFAFIGVVGGSDMVHQLIDLHDLAESHRATDGEIIDTYPQMHATCKYRYAVEGQSYERTGRACADRGVGRHVTVYFSPRDPGRSVIEDPEALFQNDLISFAMMLVLGPLFLAAVTYARARHRRSRPQEAAEFKRGEPKI